MMNETQGPESVQAGRFHMDSLPASPQEPDFPLFEDLEAGVMKRWPPGHGYFLRTRPLLNFPDFKKWGGVWL